jgi:hypothetical protein
MVGNRDGVSCWMKPILNILTLLKRHQKNSVNKQPSDEIDSLSESRFVGEKLGYRMRHLRGYFSLRDELFNRQLIGF